MEIEAKFAHSRKSAKGLYKWSAPLDPFVFLIVMSIETSTW